MPLTSGNKIENNGATPQGKLSAEEYNEVVRQINANEQAVADLDGKVVKRIKLNGTSYDPVDGVIDASVAVGTTMNVAQKKRTVVAKLGSPILLEYSFMSKNELGSTGKGEAIYYFDSTDNQPLATAEIDQSSSVDDYSVKFDVTDYISAVGSYTFIAVVKDTQGNRREIKYTVEAIDFTIQNLLYQAQTFNLGSQIPYRYGIKGSGSSEKVVYFYLNRRGSTDKVLAGTTTVQGSDTANLGITFNPSSIPLNWEHGVYTLSVYATITDGDDVIISNTIELDLMIVEPENTTPIISILRDVEVGFANTARVYETITSTITIYVPGAEDGILYLHANDHEVSSVKLDNLTPFTWNYTIEEETDSLVLWAQCGSTTASLPAIAVSGRLVNVAESTLGLALKLSSKGRSNDEANREEWKSEDDLYGTYIASLTGFNWSSNGWVDAADGARALHLTNGAKATIPFKVFGTDANNIIQNNGRTIEFEFMANNATGYDEDNKIISCYSGDVGFYVTPKRVFFQNSSGAASSLSAYFKEGERIRVGFVFQSLVEGGGMFLYLNGKQSAYYTYEPSHSFRQATSSDIIIDSTKCDIDIYRIMIYNSALTKTQMVNNFTTGKDSIADMLAVYNRNNIFYNGTLSATALQDQLPIMIMTAAGLHDWMTQANIDKKMKILVDIEFIDKADPRRSFKAKGVTLQFQGTSSMGYPVRNFKIKFKGATITGDSVFVKGVKYRLRENSFAVGTFCLKADFAESSGTHNTGAARLINDVLTTSTSGSSHPFLTPPQVSNQTTNDVRTTIDGFPIVLFSRETETGKTTFVGKYNFNNDKSTQEVFGFEGIEGFNSDLINRTSILPDADDYRTSAGDINSRSEINPCECWEFKSNDVDLCKFKFNAEDDLTHDALTTAFESRYPEEYAAPSETETATKYEDTQWGHYELKKVLMWVHSTDTTQATGAKLSVAANYGGINYLYDTAEYRLAKFKAEVSEHFNLNNLLSYFLLTDFLGAVDQRAKNQMMTSWGNEGVGDFKWYFIFYDNDTIFGINNTGKIAHDYDLASDTVGGYSGKDSVLWINLEKCFYDELCATWDIMISASKGSMPILSYENLINEFNTNQCDKWSESVFNEDSNYKYVSQGGAENKDAEYYTVLQGSRTEHRKYWIANRLEFINGKYKSNNFLAEGTGWRCNKVDGLNADESLKLTIYGARKQYFGYIIGNTTNDVFLLDEGESKFCEYTGGWDYTNLNLAGEEFITDFGDISHQLPSDMKLAKMSRLKKLVVSSEQFPNTYLTQLSLANKSFLEHLDISYASNLSSLSEFGNCYRLKKVFAFYSGLREAPFADGAAIEYAELPNLLTSLTLKNLPYLTFENLKFQNDDYSNIGALYIENCPGIKPLSFYERIAQNDGLNRVVLLDINETVKYADTTIDSLVALATNTSIPTNENRVTGVLNTDGISNLHLGILEARYKNLVINYDTLVSNVNISVTAATTSHLYERETQQLTAVISGETEDKELEWKVISGSQYASVTQDGLVTATEQCSNLSYSERVVVRVSLKVSKYIFADFELTVEGIAATGAVVTGDTWLYSSDGTSLPSVTNNSITLLPANCTKRYNQVRWYKDVSDANFGMYDINAASGDVVFNSVKAVAGKPIMTQHEFTTQFKVDLNVFGDSFTISKKLYIDYPRVGDFVYSNGSHSWSYYSEECESGELILVGVCFYVNKTGTDRRMCATGMGTAAMMWGVQGQDLALQNKTLAYIRPDSSNGGWGTEWMSYWPHDIDMELQSKLSYCAAGDMEGKTNTDRLIAERETNSYKNLDSTADITNQQAEYPAAALCRVYGDDIWVAGKKGTWWLPSAGELLLIYQNIVWNTVEHPSETKQKLLQLPSGVFTWFPGGYHWSSSELNSNGAVNVNFSNGGLGNSINGNYKSHSFRVRAVSAF